MIMPEIDKLGPRLGVGRTAEVFAWDDGRIVKLFYAGFDPAAITFEAEIGQRLSAAGLPVPRVDEIVTVGERTGIAVERIDGILLAYWHRQHPWRTRTVGHTMADLHAAIHAIRLDNLPPAVARVRRKIECASADLPAAAARTRALAMLDDLPAENVVCHSDFHVENVIMAEDRAVAIDWVGVVSGPPVLDVARTALLMLIGESPDPPPRFVRWVEKPVRSLMLNAYLTRYCNLTGLRRADLDAWALPVVAARFSEDIPLEVPARLRVIERLMAGKPVFAR